jgi:hypothetical protein
MGTGETESSKLHNHLLTSLTLLAMRTAGAWDAKGIVVVAIVMNQLTV